jgi:hypothetical protein
VKKTFWPYSGNPYEIFSILEENPRIPKTQIARRFRVNPKTAELWYDAAIKKRIIIPPVFRRKSYKNFREYFYFVKTKDPHSLYKELQNWEDIMYMSVHTGFPDFQIIARRPLSLDYDIALSGERSDYYVSTPKDHTFVDAIQNILDKLSDLKKIKEFPSPLMIREEDYVEWDDKDESIFNALTNNVRKPWIQVLKESGAYKDKIMKWFRRRNEFGDTHIMFFPQGESSYQLSLFMVETEYDWLLIDIFSELPTSSVFYRLRNKLMMGIYLPFLPSQGGRFIVRKVLSVLQKKELVTDCTNSIVEYYFRPD